MLTWERLIFNKDVYTISIVHKGLLQRRSKNVLSREYIFQKGVYSILNLVNNDDDTIYFSYMNYIRL